jgi:hypothetical protein
VKKVENYIRISLLSLLFSAFAMKRSASAIKSEIFNFSYLFPLSPFFPSTTAAPPSLSSPSPPVSPTSLSLATFLVAGSTVVSTDDAARFLPLLRDLGGEVGTVAEFLEVLGGIVNKQLTQMLLDGGG